MTKEELVKTLCVIKERMFHQAEDNTAYKVFFNHVKPVEHNESWHALPVCFESLHDDDAWGDRSRSYDYMVRLIRQMNEKLKHPDFSLRGEVLIAHAKHICYLVIGREEIFKFHASRDREKVTVKLGQGDRYTVPEVKCGDEIELKIISQQRGWLYLFCIDSEGAIDPVYPQEFGKKSDVKISTNVEFNYSEFVNGRRKDQGLGKWKFSGAISGSERVFAVTIDSEHPIALDEQYILKNYSYQLLFAHRRVSRGVGGVPDADIINLNHGDITIGFADYYYDANAPS